MAITRRPKVVDSAAVDAFIDGAPDGAAHAPSPPPSPAPRRISKATPDDATIYEKGIPKGNKRQITLTISPDLLRRVDEVAKRTGQARAAVINMAIFQAIEGNIFQS